MSVGNPGCGEVVASMERSWPSRATTMSLPDGSMVTPAARKMVITASMSSVGTCSMVTSPPAAAAATI